MILAGYSITYEKIKEQAKETLDYFRTYFGIRDYSDAEIMDGIILNSLLTEKINAKIEEISSSKSFLSFIYKNREHTALEDASLKNYNLTRIKLLLKW